VAADDLLRLVVLKFGLESGTGQKALLLQTLENFLRRMHRENRKPLLIVDEAQDLPAEALEELRLLTNLQKDNQPLLQIFLVGQQELRDTVLTRGLEQLHQRIVAACVLQPMSLENTAAYIDHRLVRAGWKGDPALNQEIFASIHDVSQGIPRIVNQVCSRLFLHGMVEDRHELGLADIGEVIASLKEEQLLPTPDVKRSLSEA
jgi:type II secretory pathway predicted ATPase ExeA